jgi:hypothetical protein
MRISRTTAPWPRAAAGSVARNPPPRYRLVGGAAGGASGSPSMSRKSGGRRAISLSVQSRTRFDGARHCRSASACRRRYKCFGIRKAMAL